MKKQEARWLRFKMSKIKQVLKIYSETIKIPQIRKKILFTLLIISWFRFLAHLPSPGIDTTLLKNFFSQSQFFSLLDIFSGGTLANFSLIALGLNPYINALVMFQLLGFVFPKINELRKEGEYGQKKLAQYTRLLTVPLALIQAIGMYFLLRGQNLINNLTLIQVVLLVFTMAGGTMILVFLGELINQHGVGNGISVIIFSGIVARYPVVVFQTLSTISQTNIFQIAIFAALAIILVIGIIMVDEAFLKVPITYARRLAGGRTYGSQASFLPLKVNTAGVMPIIFALSLLMVPSLFLGAFSRLPNPQLASMISKFNSLFHPGSFFYNFLYFLLVVIFTYFYTTVVFNPGEVAEQLRKSGGFIPGVRPGEITKNRLAFLLSRVTVIGAIFLGLVAVLPSLTQGATGISTISLGGTGILIVISVILELHRLLENLVQTWRYDHYL